MVLGRFPGHRTAKAAALLPPSMEDSLLLNSAYVEPSLVAALTGAPVTSALDTRRQLLASVMDDRDPAGSLSRYELLTYLTCCLDRMDRMSMAQGLEGRVPFLDNRVVAWGLDVPSRLKLGLRTNKQVVKQLARGRLADSIVEGRKSGFGMPLDDWFRGGVFSGFLERLRDPHHPAARYFEPGALANVLAEHQRGVANAGDLLWLLTNVYLWVEANSN
jgi:asparagine synthase (glutamine-hydrolysing)